MPTYDLDAPLISWGEEHNFTLGQAMTGAVCLGATGRGKASGPLHLAEPGSPSITMGVFGKVCARTEFMLTRVGEPIEPTGS